MIEEERENITPALKAPTQEKSLIRNAGLMSVAVLISRVLGLVREQVFAYFFGAGIAADAYNVAFRIPNLLRDLFAEGALSSAFVTVFAQSPSRERQRELARDVMTALTVLLIFVCGGIFLLSKPLVSLMAGSFAHEAGKIELTVGLTRLFSPFLYFVSSAALAMGVLNSLGSFFLPSLGAAAFNLASILVGGGLAWALYAQGPTAAIWGFGVGTLAGALTQWTVQWPGLRKNGFEPWAGFWGALHPARVRAAFADPGLRRIATLMAPSILSVAAVQINVVVDTTFATGLEEGAVSWLNFSYRIMHFPLGVFGVALSTATLPRLARLLASKDVEGFASTLEESLSWTLILAVGSTVGLIVFREPLVSLLYQHGHFTAHDTVMTGRALATFALGLVAFNSTKIFVQAFYALQSVWIPSVVSLLAIVLNYLGDLWLSKIYGHAGLALSTSITSFVNAALLIAILEAKGIPIVRRRVLRVVLSCALASLAIVLFAKMSVPEQLMNLRLLHRNGLFTALLLTSVALAGGAYMFIVSLLTPEGRVILMKLRKKFWK